MTTYAQIGAKRQLEINLGPDKKITNVKMPGLSRGQLRQIKIQLQKSINKVSGSSTLPNQRSIRKIVNSVIKQNLSPIQMPIRIHRGEDHDDLDFMRR